MRAVRAGKEVVLTDREEAIAVVKPLDVAAGRSFSSDGDGELNPAGAPEETDEGLALSAAQIDQKAPGGGNQRRS